MNKLNFKKPKAKAGCLLCQKALGNLDQSGNQPDGGTEFFTMGHYGSAVSDFMDGTGLAVNICDPCLTAARKKALVLLSEPPPVVPRPRRKYRVWR